MAFPTGWPPRVPSGIRNIRFFQLGATGGGFDANAYLFIDGVGANPHTPLPTVRAGEDVSTPDYSGPHNVDSLPAGTGEQGDDPKAMLWAQNIIVHNDGTTDLEVSFDGTNVHGIVPAGEERNYYDRREAGIAVRGGGVLATGTIDTVSVANLNDGETFTIDDGINPATVFEFDVVGDGVSGGNVAVDVSAIITADEVKDEVISVINSLGSSFLITATNGGSANVVLTNNVGGDQGNTTSSDTVTHVSFVVSNMAGGDNADFRIEAW